MIIDLQRRLAEIGRIRIGQQVPTGSKGKTRPEKLATFRLTSPDRNRLDHAARVYGGQVEPWQAPAGQQWEVITTAEALDVIVPPSDMAFSQHYELWSAGGCQRRCDGRHESISDGLCVCDPAARECDIHTRLSVLLRDLPGLGVWRIDTSGYYAAVELQGAVEVIQIAAGRGQMLPARLRLEQRQVKRPGQTVRRFAVPVLDIEVSPGQLMAASTPLSQLAAADGPAALTPVPAALPAAPVRSVADQAKAVDSPEPGTPRRNAAQPLPPTGLAPRTAAQATGEPAGMIPARIGRAGLPPLPGEDEPEAQPPSGRDAHGTATRGKGGQLTALWTVLSTEFGFTSDQKEQARVVVEQIISRDLDGGTTGDLSWNEAQTVLDTLSNCIAVARERGEPPHSVLIAAMVAADQAGSEAGDG